MNWIASQSVTPFDIVAAVGHSYGGNRARRFVDDLKLAGMKASFLATIDPLDWDYCNILQVVGGGTSVCNQSGSVYAHSAANAQSFHQVLGQQVCLPKSPTFCTTFPVEGYTLNNASVMLRPDYHMAIDDDSTAHTTITTALLNLVRGPQVTSTVGVLSRTASAINVPIQTSVTGFGTATGITITSASLNGVPASNLVSVGGVGDVLAGSSSGALTLMFPATAAAGHSSATLTVNGTYSFGQTFTNTFGRISVP
jgi:hypothetical protein